MEIALIHKDSTRYQIIENAPLQKGTITYDGETHTPEWYYYDSDTVTIEITAKTDAGSYTAKFKPKTGYCWKDLTTKKISVNWQILPQQIISLPTQTDIPVYDKNNHTPVWTNRQEDKLTISVTAHMNPGTYIATFTPKKNYRWAPSILEDERVGYPVSWRIDKRILDEPSLSQSSFPYTGSYYDITTMISGQNSYMTRSGTTRQKTRGRYKITFTINTNYCSWRNTEGNKVVLVWAIGYQVVPIPSAARISFVYDKTKHSLEISGETDYCDRHGVIENTTAGKYDVWYTLKDKTSSVWSDDTTEDKYIHWEITPKSLTKPYLKSTIDPNFRYDGHEHEIKMSDILGYDSNTMMLVSDTFKATNKGRYLISFILKDSINYRWAAPPYYEEVKILWSIGSIVLKMPDILNKNLPYTGSLISPQIQNKPADDLVDQIGTISARSIGDYEVIYTLVYPDRYKWEEETEDGDAHISWSIVTRTLQKPVISGADIFPYTKGRTQGPDILHYEEQKSFLKRTGNWSEEEAGEYTVTFSLNSEEGLAFEGTTDTSVSLSWSISSKIAPSTFSQDGHLYYSGENLVPAISGYNSSVHYKEGEVTASSVGVHRLFILPKENYTWSDGTKTAIPVDWTIEGLPVPLPTADPDIYDYTGSEVTLNLTADKDTDGEYLWITVTGDKGAAPGQYTAKATLKDPDSSYFVDSDGEQLTIRETEISWQIRVYRHDKPYLSKSVFEYDPNGSVYITGTDQDGEYLYIVNYDPEYMKASGDILRYNKGTYTLRIDLDPDQDIVWRDDTKNTVTLPWSISGERLTLKQSVWEQDEDILYDSQEHRAPFSVYSSVYHKYNTETSRWFATAAGTYHIFVSPAGNYSWSDGTSAERDMTWQISPINIPTPRISGKNSFSYSKRGSTVKIINDQSPYIRTTGDDEFQTKPKTYSRTFTLMDDNVSFSDTSARSVTLTWRILADQKIAKPVAATTSYEYDDGEDIYLVLTDILDEDFITQTGVDHSNSVGNYTATYVVDSTTSLWADNTTAPVNIPWSITRKRIPASNSSFSLTQRIVGNGNTQYVVDFLEGYNAQYHILSGNTYQKDPAQNLTLRIDLQSNYAWSDGTTGQKTLVWSVAPPELFIEVYSDAEHKNRIYQISLSDEDTLEKDIYVLTSEAVSQISASSRNNNIAVVGADKGSGKNHIFQVTGLQTGSVILDFSVPATAKYEAGETSLTVGVTISKDISELAWADIKEAVQNGKIANIARVGDKIPIYLTGTLGGISVAGDYVAVIIGVNHNPTVELSSNVQFALQTTGGDDVAIVGTEEEDSEYSYRRVTTPYILNPGDENVPISSYTLEEMTWSDIANFNKRGLLSSLVSVGDTKDITLTGSLGGTSVAGDYRAVLIGLNHDSETSLQYSAQFSIQDSAGNDIAIVGGTEEDSSYSYRGADTPYIINVGETAVQISLNLDDYTWQQISDFNKTGLLANLVAIGDTKDITLTGSLEGVSVADYYQAVIIDIDHNTEGTLQRSIHFALQKDGQDIAICLDDNDDDTAFSYRRNNCRYLPDSGADIPDIIPTYSFNDYTWNDIKQFVAHDILQNLVAVGDTKDITLTGSLGETSVAGNYKVVVIGINHEVNTGYQSSVHFSIKDSDAHDIAIESYSYSLSDFWEV